MSANKLKLFHEEIMQEEGLKISDLPIEIQKKLKGFNLMKGKWEKNPDNERDFVSLQKSAIKIGDLIQNFVEQDYDEDEEEGQKKYKDYSKSKNEKPQKNEKQEEDDDEKKSDNSKIETPVKKQPTGKFGNSMMEKKILSIMESKGENRIRISDLEAIIGREPDYPEQVVNNIKLRKVFLSSEYRLV